MTCAALSGLIPSSVEQMREGKEKPEIKQQIKSCLSLHSRGSVMRTVHECLFILVRATPNHCASTDDPALGRLR